MLSLLCWGLGDGSLFRELLGELPARSPLGWAQQGLWICFWYCLKEKKKIYFFEERTAHSGSCS